MDNKRSVSNECSCCRLISNIVYQDLCYFCFLNEKNKICL